MTHSRVASLIILTWLALGSARADASFIDVADPANGDPSLQDAIDGAQPGDVIRVGPGHFLLGQAVNANSSGVVIQGSAQGTTLEAYGGGDVFTAFGDDLTIDRLNLTGLGTCINSHGFRLRVSNSLVACKNTGIYTTRGVIVVNSTVTDAVIGILSTESAGSLGLFNVTISGNDTGVNCHHANLAIANSIAVGSTYFDGARDVVIRSPAGLIDSRGGNFIGGVVNDFDPDMSISGWASSDSVGVANDLGPLLSYGGPTRVFALGEHSWERDYLALCQDDGGQTITTDQLGNPRDDGRCDAGAFEFQAGGNGGTCDLGGVEAAIAGITTLVAPLDAAVSTRSSQESVSSLAVAVGALSSKADLLATAGSVATVRAAIGATLDEIIAARQEIGEVSDGVSAVQSSVDSVQDSCAASATAVQVTALDVRVQALGNAVQALAADDRALDTVIEARLADGSIRLASLYMPASRGGQLERVRSIVTRTVSNVQGAGYNVHNAMALLAEGNQRMAAGDYRGAYGQYLKAYQAAN